MVPWTVALAVARVETATVETLSKLFTESEGNITKLAEAAGCDVDLMDSNMPADAEDFAKKVLAGTYQREKRPEPKRMPKPPVKWRRTGCNVRQATGFEWEYS